MLRQAVNSSNLQSVGYDPTSNTLEIEFRTKSLYQYLDVPASIYQELMVASSHGRYFNQQIRDQYQYIIIR